ncbi:hypothetical protein ACJW30_07G061600 [Castanea mollissima]
MGSARFLEQSLIVTFFLLLYRNVLGQGGTPSVDPDEKNALYVLKSIFNNSIINESWKGDPCDLAYPCNLGLYGPPLTTTSRSINGTGEPPSGNSPPNSNGDIVKNIFLVFVVILIAAVILLLILYCQKAQMVKKMLNEANKEEAGEGDKIIEAAEKSIVVAAKESRNLIFMEDEPAFGINDVLRGFAEGLGKGIFGNSYKAKVSGGASVVVKRLRDLKPMTSEEFKKQLRTIGDMKHPNLLSLLAYYYSNEEKFLLYNYAAKGERGGDRISFKWNERLLVARGIARALEYLHLNTKCQSIVVPHGNLKSSNVLFDENDKVLISDYGLTSLLALPIAIQHMILARTAPPGVNDTVDLCNWVRRALREEWTAEVFDLEISTQRNAVPGMLRLLQIAMQCCDNTPKERPEMTQVVREVENIKVPELGDENDGSLDGHSKMILYQPLELEKRNDIEELKNCFPTPP